MIDVEKEEYQAQGDNLLPTPDNEERVRPLSIFRMLALVFSLYLLLLVNYLFLNFNLIFAIFSIIVSLVQFYVLKSYDGIELVGMKWYFGYNEENVFALIYYAKPDPYVPNRNLYRLFWSVLYLDLITWLVIFLCSSIFVQTTAMFTSGTTLMLKYVNVFGFYHCREKMKQQNEEVARGVILGDDIQVTNQQL